MILIKRSGVQQKYDPAKLTNFVRIYSSDLDADFINHCDFVSKVEKGICDYMTTRDVLDYCGETAATCMSIHPDFGLLASRIVIAKLHKETLPTFSEKIELLYQNTKFISKEIYELVRDNREEIDAMVDYSRDSKLTYFGLQTLQRSYLLQCQSRCVERPQDMFMRVALEIHRGDLRAVQETYDLMSNKYYIHGTPTLFNASTPRPQMCSCFLLTIKEDSAAGIFETLTQAMNIAKFAGGIGINAAHVRSRGSPMSTGGVSNGIIAMIRVFEAMSRFISQCGNKRTSSIAFFIEPWHPEVFEFLDLRKNTGKEEMRSRSIFTALWVPDLFMQRVERNESWSLFCPNVARGLNDVYGKEFEDLYTRYEREGLASKTIQAQRLWRAIVESQIETGTPYILYKDAINKKNNQKNLGTIRCSNLCSEVVQYTSREEIAVCNLASLALPTFVEEGVFNLEKLRAVTKTVARNLNRVIDRTFYPVQETRTSNLRHRPLGIGVQGLADVLAMLKHPFDSEEALALNRDIFETIYFGALEASCELAQKDGPYESYQGSPISEGVLQFDMWGVRPSGRWDWEGLRRRIAQFGVRNSLLVSLMPTATTSQILGFNECFEPFTSNIYTRRTLAGEFQVVNSYLIRDLVKLGLWSPELKNLIIEHDGSIQKIKSIPDSLKLLYRTVWELRMKTVIDMAASRAPFVDQTQSMNIFISEPTFAQLTSMHFYGWRAGLKTGLYYLRTQPISSAIKFTVDKEMVRRGTEGSSCSLDDENCESCAA